MSANSYDVSVNILSSTEASWYLLISSLSLQETNSSIKKSYQNEIGFQGCGCCFCPWNNKPTFNKFLIFQKILGEKVASELRYFGQAIDGELDLGEDGLPDIVVGSQGKVIVLK